MARVPGEFRWTLLPTLATYYIYRIQKKYREDRVSNYTSLLQPLKDLVQNRYEMPMNGVNLKIDRNLKEAEEIYLGIFTGKKGSNFHDNYVVERFHNYSLENLEDFFYQIIEDDLTIKSRDMLLSHTNEILKSLPVQKELYIRKYFEQGLDISSIVGEHDPSFKANVFQDVDDISYINQIEILRDRQVLSQDEIDERRVAKAPISLSSRRWPRDKDISWTALTKANHQCEFNPQHQTFTRCFDDVPYMEPHHIIPMSFQGEFKLSLDCLENLISLCPNCHRAIHYSNVEYRKKMLGIVFEERKRKLQEIGVNIEFSELCRYYNIK